MTSFVECYADEVFVKILTDKSVRIKHAFGKGNVCNQLSRSTNSVGLVDEDPKSSKSEYERLMLNGIVKENQHVILCKHENQSNRLIILRPNLEEFLLRLSKINKVDLGDYNLPNDYKNLRDELNFRKVTRYKLFEDFLRDLTSKDKEVLNLIKNFFKETWTIR